MSAADSIRALEVRAEKITWLRRSLPWVIAAACVALVFRNCHRPQPTPLIPSIAAKVEQHAIASAVDTVELHRLAVVAANAAAAKDSALRLARASQALAALEHQRADSLAALAVAARTAQDSATDWHAAYDARTVEADSLTAASHEKDAALQALAVDVAAKDSSLTRISAHAARADSIIVSAVAALRQSEPPCRLARFFSCPSRTKTAIGGILVGSAAVLASHAFLRVP